MTGAEIVVDGGWMLESGESLPKAVLIRSILMMRVLCEHVVDRKCPIQFHSMVSLCKSDTYKNRSMSNVIVMSFGKKASVSIGQGGNGSVTDL